MIEFKTIIDKDFYEIWRFMMDEKHQGKGYGRASLIKSIELIEKLPHGPAKGIYLSYVPDNVVGKGLYESDGFKNTGKIVDGEGLMVYAL